MSVLLINSIDKFLHMERHTFHSLQTSLQVSSQARASSPTLITPGRALLEQTGVQLCSPHFQAEPASSSCSVPDSPSIASNSGSPALVRISITWGARYSTVSWTAHSATTEYTCFIRPWVCTLIGKTDSYFEPLLLGSHRDSQFLL